MIRLELLVSDVERLSLVGRLSGGFDRCAHKSHGGPLPTSPLQPQVPGTQRGLPVPPGADTDIPLVGAGPGGPSKHATTPPIWGLPGALGASAPPQSTAARRPRVFYWGEARGLMPGGRGPQTPHRPSVIRLSSSVQEEARGQLSDGRGNLFAQDSPNKFQAIRKLRFRVVRAKSRNFTWQLRRIAEGLVCD